jgi:hypothetical protein
MGLILPVQPLVGSLKAVFELAVRPVTKGDPAQTLWVPPVALRRCRRPKPLAFGGET